MDMYTIVVLFVQALLNSGADKRIYAEDGQTPEHVRIINVLFVYIILIFYNSNTYRLIEY